MPIQLPEAAALQCVCSVCDTIQESTRRSPFHLHDDVTVLVKIVEQTDGFSILAASLTMPLFDSSHAFSDGHIDNSV